MLHAPSLLLYHTPALLSMLRLALHNALAPASPSPLCLPHPCIPLLQGREKDIVIFSCVRTAGVHHRSIGFVADERRINVGITRARCALLIIGHAASLATDERWRNLVRSAAERDCLYQPSKPYSTYMNQVGGNVQCGQDSHRSCGLCWLTGLVAIL